jgi:hypothetical protein
LNVEVTKSSSNSELGMLAHQLSNLCMALHFAMMEETIECGDQVNWASKHVRNGDYSVSVRLKEGKAIEREEFALFAS